MAEILEVQNLKTYFITKEKTVKAVDDVSFTIHQGESFALVGESGCGKSATCRSILHLVRAPGRTWAVTSCTKGRIWRLSPTGKCARFAASRSP